MSAEQWWRNHAKLLAAKMQVGGVKEFRIFLNYKGNYEFEVVPTATPNARTQRPGTSDSPIANRGAMPGPANNPKV